MCDNEQETAEESDWSRWTRGAGGEVWEPRVQERGGDSLIQCALTILVCSSAASHLIIHGVFKVQTSNLGSVPLWLFSIKPLCVVEVPSACGIAASNGWYRITRQAFECIAFNHRHSLGWQDDRLKKKKSEHLVTDDCFMARNLCIYADIFTSHENRIIRHFANSTSRLKQNSRIQTLTRSVHSFKHSDNDDGIRHLNCFPIECAFLESTSSWISRRIGYERHRVTGSIPPRPRGCHSLEEASNHTNPCCYNKDILPSLRKKNPLCGPSEHGNTQGVGLRCPHVAFRRTKDALWQTSRQAWSSFVFGFLLKEQCPAATASASQLLKIHNPRTSWSHAKVIAY